MKEIFDKKQSFFHGFFQKQQGRQGDGADPQEKRGQKTGHPPSRPSESQEIEHRAEHQDEGHEQPQPSVAYGKAQQKQYQGGQKTEQQIRQEPGPIQSQLPPQSGHQIVNQSEQGTAGQRTQGLQPLPSGIQAHQPRSLPIQRRRPGAFSA